MEIHGHTHTHTHTHTASQTDKDKIDSQPDSELVRWRQTDRQMANGKVGT